jgi:hypothetical protein
VFRKVASNNDVTEEVRFFWLPQIRAANIIHLGSKNYFFWAANFNGKGSRFY